MNLFLDYLCLSIRHHFYNPLKEKKQEISSLFQKTRNIAHSFYVYPYLSPWNVLLDNCSCIIGKTTDLAVVFKTLISIATLMSQSLSEK